MKKLILLIGMLSLFCAVAVKAVPIFNNYPYGDGSRRPTVVYEEDRTISGHRGESTVLSFRLALYGTVGTNLPMLVQVHEWGGDFRREEDLAAYDPSQYNFVMLYFQFKPSTGNEDNWWFGTHWDGVCRMWSHEAVMSIVREVIATPAIVSSHLSGATIDPNRVYLFGSSVGGTGAWQLGVRNPDVFAAFHAHSGFARFTGAVGPFEAQFNADIVGSPSDGVTIVGGDSISYPARNYSDLSWWLTNYRNASYDTPFANFTGGTADDIVPLSSGGDLMRPIFDTQKRGFFFYRNSGGHSTACFPQLNLMWNFRLNQSFLAFTNRSGYGITPDQTVGPELEDIGGINDLHEFYWDTDTIMDQETHYEVRIEGTGSADVTPRRLQNFDISPGGTYLYWLDSMTGAGTAVTADANGLLTIPAVSAGHLLIIEADIPETATLTMSVSPELGGTTVPTTGSSTVNTQEAIAITASAAPDYRFLNWTSSGSVTIANANAESTTATLTNNATVTANFIPTIATLTMSVSPASGGTTLPIAGTHAVNTEEAIPVTASAAAGFRFLNWTSSGSVTVTAPASATTSVTLTGNATVTANFLAVPDSVNLMFIHHSCGQNWLDSGLRTAVDAKSYIDEVNEITYTDVVTSDAGRPSSLGAVPGDSTDMSAWLYWFNDYLGNVETFRCETDTNRIIMFKSCYPNSHIEESGSGSGNPFDTLHTIVNHQAVFRNAAGAGIAYPNSNGYNYHALADVFAANPDTLFIYVTAPPECYADATATTGKNARIFNNWLKQTWLPEYNTLHPGLNNVQIFDWFDVLANADSGLTYSNMLKAAYGGESGDSHPNETANLASTVIYAGGTPNFIDLSWMRYTGTATQSALTTAIAPLGGGITNPVAGTSDVYTPLVISATAAAGYRFVNWSISANGLVYNTESPVTTVLMSGAATATANFAAVPYMTLGSLKIFSVDDLSDEFTGTAFGGKPSMSALFADPASNESPQPQKKAPLKTTFDTAQNTQFTAEWTKKQPLFNKRNIPAGVDSWTYLRDNADIITNLICNTTVKAKAPGARAVTCNAGLIYVPWPEITGLQNQSGTLIDPPVVVSPGDTIYLVGNYFGCKAPNVWFEYNSNGRIKQTKCKVLKNLFSATYLDSKGKPSCMDCESGVSRVPIQIPSANKIPEGGFLGFLVIDNGLGRDTINMMIE